MFKNLVVLTFLSLLSISCGGGGGGGGGADAGTGGTGGGTSTPVSITAKVYDQSIASATIEFFAGIKLLGTTTSDINGSYTVNLNVAAADRGLVCVAVATRGNVKLRSILGNCGTVADAAAANGNNLTENTLPSANVTNVSTAIAAVIEQAGGIPDSQADIDAALAVIANDPSVVIQISVAIKAVVDYGATTTGNTAELAAALAKSGTLATDVTTVVATSTTTEAALTLEVTGDPTLALQIPTSNSTLLADIVGKTFVTSSAAGEETMIMFNSPTAVTIAEYGDIETGGLAGTYVTDAIAGTITITFTEVGNTNPSVAKLTLTGGNINFITTDVVFIDGANGVTTNDGPHTLRRLMPVVAGASSPTQISVAAIVNKLFVVVDESTSFKMIDTCDGSATTELRSSLGVTKVATCNLALGMMVLTDNGGTKTMVGLLADSWDGANLSQQISAVNWRSDIALGSVAEYGRLHRPLPANLPVLGNKFLRIYPSVNGIVESQLMFVTGEDTILDNTVSNGGLIDIYNFDRNNNGTGTAKSKEHIWQVTRPGGLVVNASIDIGTTYDSDPTSVGINLGQSPNSGIGAVIKAKSNGAILSRYTYKLENIIAADIAGKSFNFTDLIHPGTGGTISFSAGDASGGTGIISDNFGPGTFTWSIAEAVRAANTTSVTSYGQTLKLNFSEDTGTDYVFVKKLGDTLIIAGYYLSATNIYEENYALSLTPQ